MGLQTDAMNGIESSVVGRLRIWDCMGGNGVCLSGDAIVPTDRRGWKIRVFDLCSEIFNFREKGLNKLRLGIYGADLGRSRQIGRAHV